MEQKIVTASIVLYNNDIVKLKKAIDSFLLTKVRKHLYLIDNSETRSLEQQLQYDSSCVTYLYTGLNIGFGMGHNFILDRIEKESKYHLILNPDVFFSKNVLQSLIDFLEENPLIGLVGPQIVYPNGDLQHSIRKFPMPQDLFIRRISFLKKVFHKRYRNYHYLESCLDDIMDVDSVSGCFQLFNTEVFLSINGFDNRYFMYMEDIDICKEVIKSGYRVVYHPKEKVTHYFEKGSAKNIKLFLIHFHSFIKYFMKWKLS